MCVVNRSDRAPAVEPSRAGVPASRGGNCRAIARDDRDGYSNHGVFCDARAHTDAAQLTVREALTARDPSTSTTRCRRLVWASGDAGVPGETSRAPYYFSRISERVSVNWVPERADIGIETLLIARKRRKGGGARLSVTAGAACGARASENCGAAADSARSGVLRGCAPAVRMHASARWHGALRRPTFHPNAPLG